MYVTINSCRRFLFAFLFLFFVFIVSHQCCYSKFSFFSIHLLSFVPYTWNDLSHRRGRHWWCWPFQQPTTTVMWFSLAYSVYCIVVVDKFFFFSRWQMVPARMAAMMLDVFMCTVRVQAPVPLSVEDFEHSRAPLRTFRCRTLCHNQSAINRTTITTSTTTSDLSRPPRGGVITPQFSCDSPTIWSSKWVIRGCLQVGVYVIVMERVINVVKYWHEPIYLLYETNNAQNLVILFSGILLKLLPPDVIFCS